MSFEENTKPHNIIIEGRRKTSVTGVTEVESFDESEIIMDTTLGTLILQGETLRIDKMNIDTGDVTVAGTVTSATYEDQSEKSQGFLSRLFK
jgi:sporulation protein YabP